jgi:hypothetical protein
MASLNSTRILPIAASTRPAPDSNAVTIAIAADRSVALASTRAVSQAARSAAGTSSAARKRSSTIMVRGAEFPEVIEKFWFVTAKV